MSTHEELEALQKLQEKMTPLEELRQVYENELKVNAESRSLDSKVIWFALNYVSGSFFTVDDFWRFETYSRSYNGIRITIKYIDYDNSFEKMIGLNKTNIDKEEYRKAFCRLITWKQFVHKFQSGKAYLVRKQDEIYCRILMKFGSIDDVVHVAQCYSDLLANEDLIQKTREAIDLRNIGASKVLLEILVRNEGGHPEIPKLKIDLERLEKIKRLHEKDRINDTVIANMSGVEFEQLVANMFEKLGFRVDITPKSGDYGADVILVSPNETRVSVQCKRFKAKVNLKAVQEVVASLSHYQCDFGVVITNSTFLSSARKLAENNDIELWDKDYLINFLSGDISFSELQNL